MPLGILGLLRVVVLGALLADHGSQNENAFSPAFDEAMPPRYWVTTLLASGWSALSGVFSQRRKRLKPGILARPIKRSRNCSIRIPTFDLVHHSGGTHMLRDADAVNERREFQ
jgi:hypothetical protein